MPLDTYQRKIKLIDADFVQHILSDDVTVSPEIDARAECLCQYGHCSCGSICSLCQSPWSLNTEFDSNVRVCQQWKMSTIRVMKLKCSTCDNSILWDGYDEGIFRFSQNSAFSHAIMYEVLDIVALANATYNSIHALMEKQHARHGSSFFSIKPFIKSIWLFLKLLDYDWEDAMSCPHCGDLSTCVFNIVYGTHIGPTLERLKNHSWPMITEELTDENPVKIGSSFKNRVCIADSSARLAISEFSKSTESEPLSLQVNLSFQNILYSKRV